MILLHEIHIETLEVWISHTQWKRFVICGALCSGDVMGFESFQFNLVASIVRVKRQNSVV